MEPVKNAPVRHDLPCEHELAGRHKHNSAVPDHEPLTRDQVSALLKRAGELAEDFEINESELASIYRRLVQAIPGMVCPSEHAPDSVYERECELQYLYTSGVNDGNIASKTDAIYEIMRK